MSFLSSVFNKKKQQQHDIAQTHVIVEKKSAQAHDLLDEIESKMYTVSNEIEQERCRSNRELDQKTKELKDVVAQMAYIIGIS